MHIGRDGINGKTEAMYFPPPSRTAPATPDTPPLTANYPVSDGFIHFTFTFRYLGATIHASLSDSDDIHARIAASSAAFAALKDTVFYNSALSYAAKRATYHAYVLSILLYGCEAWTLTKSLVTKLRSFHRRCIRQIFG